MTTDELMTQSEVAALLDVNTATLANWRSAGKGPKFVKLVGRVKYRAVDVEAFVNSSVRQSTCKAAA
jgi:predicted site-specific integrase-resolvase